MSPAALLHRRHSGEEYKYLRWRWWVLALVSFQVFSAAGVIYGWPALESALIDEGLYADQCATTATAPAVAEAATGSHHAVCAGQLLKLNTMFVAASWGAQAGGLIGFLLDKVGVRVTVVASSLAVAVGAAGFALSGAGGFGFDARVPALTLMGLAGNGIYLAAQALGDLFPDHTQFALFAISACFAPGTLVFLFFHTAVDSAGATLRACFLFYAGFQTLLALVSAFVWPHRFDAEAVKAGLRARKTPKAEAASDRKPASQTDDIAATMAQDPEFTAVLPTPHKPGGRQLHRVRTGSMPLLGLPGGAAKQSFVDFARTPRFLAQVAFFSILMLPAQFFIGTAGSQIARVTPDSDEVDAYVRYFNLTYSLVSFLTPAFGWLTTRIGFGGSFAFVNTMFLASFAVVSLAPSAGWFIPADVLYTIARSLQFSTFFAYIGDEFGFAHIGKLAGLGFLVSAMVSLLQVSVAGAWPCG